MHPVLVVQHEEECPPAMLGDWLEQAGLTLDVRRPYAGRPLPADLGGHSALVVLGGSMGAGEDTEHPWLKPTRELVRVAAADRVPTLGVCLGHQLAAVALGGRVERNPAGQLMGVLELGWVDGADPDLLLATRPARGIHWNSDIVVEPPAGTRTLARTPDGVLQAARYAATVWGVQAHPEADDRVVAPWAEWDRAAYPEGHVAAVQQQVAAAVPELVLAWRPVAEAFAALVRASASTDIGDIPAGAGNPAPHVGRVPDPSNA